MPNKVKLYVDLWVPSWRSALPTANDVYVTNVERPVPDGYMRLGELHVDLPFELPDLEAVREFQAASVAAERAEAILRAEEALKNLRGLPPSYHEHLKEGVK